MEAWPPKVKAKIYLNREIKHKHMDPMTSLPRSWQNDGEKITHRHGQQDGVGGGTHAGPDE